MLNQVRLWSSEFQRIDQNELYGRLAECGNVTDGVASRRDYIQPFMGVLGDPSDDLTTAVLARKHLTQKIETADNKITDDGRNSKSKNPAHSRIQVVKIHMADWHRQVPAKEGQHTNMITAVNVHLNCVTARKATTGPGGGRSRLEELLERVSLPRRGRQAYDSGRGF